MKFFQEIQCVCVGDALDKNFIIEVHVAPLRPPHMPYVEVASVVIVYLHALDGRSKWVLLVLVNIKYIFAI